MTNLSQWVEKFAGVKVLVVGDLILDEYLTGRAARLSREAPVPVLEYESRQHIPGGAGNPAANIAALGAGAIPLSIIGDDVEGETLKHILAARNMTTKALVTDPTRPTTLKTRIMAHMGLRFPQQVARIDRLSRQPIADEVEQALIQQFNECAPKVSAVLFSDYHGGACTPALVNAAHQHDHLLLTADAQGSLAKYAGFHVVKCNADEASAFLGVSLTTDEEYGRAAAHLAALLQLTKGMVITRGGDGATISNNTGDVEHLPAPATTDVFDTVGAGDTTIAVITLALVAGATLSEAVRLANYASGIVVRHVGNYAPSAAELLSALSTT